MTRVQLTQLPRGSNIIKKSFFSLKKKQILNDKNSTLHRSSSWKHTRLLEIQCSILGTKDFKYFFSHSKLVEVGEVPSNSILGNNQKC
jgi:hypothetical protein